MFTRPLFVLRINTLETKTIDMQNTWKNKKEINNIPKHKNKIERKEMGKKERQKAKKKKEKMDLSFAFLLHLFCFFDLLFGCFYVAFLLLVDTFIYFPFWCFFPFILLPLFFSVLKICFLIFHLCSFCFAVFQI